MKLIEVIANVGHKDTLAAIAEEVRTGELLALPTNDPDTSLMRFFVADDQVQQTLDKLQTLLGTQTAASIAVYSPETVLPKADIAERQLEDRATVTRESLYDGIEKSAQLDQNFVLLVILSTVVATIGLLEDNVAVVIGAMVIAPLLGPNLALALGSVLGDLQLMRKALRVNGVGIILTMVITVVIGYLWPMVVVSDEVAARAIVSMDSVVLALASGAAAALSLTTGLSAILVGVMVAVALLPPAAAAGLLLGNGNYHLAAGAALLLVINVTCVNLATCLVFLSKRIGPRTWQEKTRARRATGVLVFMGVVAVGVLILAVVLYEQLVAPVL
ncbi:MAG: TIGR00341 family protein [Immundisolibacteraceae bacterium]|nr:TIGR00341 family protein [Immundisolibacteraceae bacterium]